MKLVKGGKDEIKESKEFPGLIQCDWNYKISETRAALTYAGPFIPPRVWHEVLSFFKWTYDEHHSESQVRLYVNPVTKSWGAWAFPQEARTGMTAKELSVTETEEQARVRFAHWGGEPSGDWIYFATVHHHCSGGAFQSGTDEANEKGQDGLHITVGEMDKPKHSLHARFYLSGCQFNPDLSLFWDIGDLARQVCPPGVWDEVARYQMGQQVTVEFPSVWKENVIEIKSSVTVYGGSGSVGGSYDYRNSGVYMGGGGVGFKPKFKRTEEAVDEFEIACEINGVDDKKLRAFIEQFDEKWGDPLLVAMVELLDQHEVDFAAFIREIKWDLDKAERHNCTIIEAAGLGQEIKERVKAESGGTPSNGNGHAANQTLLAEMMDEEEKAATGGGSSPAMPTKEEYDRMIAQAWSVD